MPAESSSHTDHSGEDLNCTPSQTTTAPERNLSVNTIYNKNDGSFYTHRSDKKKKSTGVNSQCASILLI